MLVIVMVVLGIVGRMVMDYDDTHHAHTYSHREKNQQTDTIKRQSKDTRPCFYRHAQACTCAGELVCFKVLGIFMYHLMYHMALGNK